MFNTPINTVIQLWRDMPSYYGVSWETYKVKPQPNSLIRLFAMIIAFLQRDIVPIFDGTELILDLRGQKNNKRAESKLNYEWEVCDEDSGKRVKTGLGEIILPRVGAIVTKQKAIHIEQLTKPAKYLLRIKLSNNIYGVSDYMTISRFTVRDWDDFCASVIWPVLIAVSLSIIGGMVGWFLRGGYNGG